MIEPLLADLLAGALAHGLLDVVAGLIGKEGVDPHAHSAGLLLLELWLAVDGPGEQPVGVLHAHDAAGDHAAGERVALADLLDIGQDALVQGGDGSALPVGELGG